MAVLGDRWLRRWRPCPPERNLTTWPSTRPARRWRPVRRCAAAVMQAAGELALRTHRALGLEVYSRTDMILDKDGNLWVLEANSLRA